MANVISTCFYGLYEKIAEQYQTSYMPFMLGSVVLNKQLRTQNRLHSNENSEEQSKL